MTTPKCHRIRKNCRGFTLIELLVVIAIIALLLVVIIPALKSAKNIAAAAVCLSNEGQLIKAWLLYAEDYDANIVDGDVGSRTDPGYQSYRIDMTYLRVFCWVSRPMGPNGEDYNKTLDDKIRGFQAGGLWHYLEAPKVYNCPIDKRWVKPAVCPNNNCNNYDPDWYGGYRSYSIGNVLSQRPVSGTGEEDYVVTKLSEFSNPGSKIVFLEEADGMGWNDRTWNMYLNEIEWYDPFAIWHSGSSTFGFADGHADRHRWVSKKTIELSEEQKKNISAMNDYNTGPSEDYLWFKRAYIPGK